MLNISIAGDLFKMAGSGRFGSDNDQGPYGRNKEHIVKILTGGFTNTQMHKYTNTQIRKFTNSQINK